MFDWLKSILGGKRKPSFAALDAAADMRARTMAFQAAANPAQHILSREDAPLIAEGLRGLAALGLRPRPDMQGDWESVARKIAANNEGICFSRAPARGDWAVIALQNEETPFLNAARFEDHCYDVAELDDYSEMISQILGLAADEWPVESVIVTNADGEAQMPKLGEPVRVVIQAAPSVEPFTLTHDKDFDWSLIYRLNERLPAGVTGRFAIFLDGDATIVFLPPERIEQLNALCGYEFFHEDDFGHEGVTQ